MSDEPEQPSTAKSLPESGAPSQIERDGHRAEIIHPDGTREQVQIAVERSWSGILPRPEDFAKYAAVVPDAPERLLRMAEREQAHRIDLERRILPENQRAGRRGQVLGALVSIIALVLAAITAMLDAPWQVSIALVGVPVLSVARALVTAFRQTD